MPEAEFPLTVFIFYFFQFLRYTKNGLIFQATKYSKLDRSDGGEKGNVLRKKLNVETR